MGNKPAQLLHGQVWVTKWDPETGKHREPRPIRQEVLFETIGKGWKVCGPKGTNAWDVQGAEGGSPEEGGLLRAGDGVPELRGIPEPDDVVAAGAERPVTVVEEDDLTPPPPGAELGDDPDEGESELVEPDDEIVLPAAPPGVTTSPTVGGARKRKAN